MSLQQDPVFHPVHPRSGQRLFRSHTLIHDATDHLNDGRNDACTAGRTEGHDRHTVLQQDDRRDM